MLGCRGVLLRLSSRTTPISTALRATSTTMTPSPAYTCAHVESIAAPALQVVQNLEPKAMWTFFAHLTAIPRPSKQEHKVVEWLKDFAAIRGLEFKQDAIGNVLITRPGSAGGENAPYVMLQGHIDMVCEANSETKHDFTRDPLKIKIDGDWLKAEGTTLGSDNGIGVCTALALLDAPKTMKLPPIEALFTIDEETGLTGAFELDGSMIKSRVLLNLDTENIDEIIIGCAGGGDSRIVMPASHQDAPTSGHTAYTVDIKGFMGGHSGVNIHEDRGNSVITLARVLAAAGKALGGTLPLVASMHGGDKRNAIPREAVATVLVPSAQAQAFEASVAKTAAELKAEYGSKEPDMVVRAVAYTGAAPTQVIAPKHAQAIVDLLRTLPHGVAKFSHVLPNLVETSNNVASIRVEGDKATVVCSTRSSIMSALEAHRDKLEVIAQSLGCVVFEREEAYPGWAPSASSPIRDIAAAAYKRVLGKEPHVTAIHAGLEVGILQDKVPGMDGVSYGPTITGAHSPDERVQISTIMPFWNMTVEILSVLADKKA